MNTRSPNELTGYFGFLFTTFGQTFRGIVRRKQFLLVVCVAMIPVLLPPIVAYFGPEHGARFGPRFLVRVVQNLYIQTFAPLIALFYASMLVGEDVESQTIPYLLTRPIPRSAWVLGKFLAFVLIGWVVLLVPVTIICFSSIGLGWIEYSNETLTLLLHYIGVILMAVIGYGSFCLFLGALIKRPIIGGLLFIYGWQKLAVNMPGLIDFLTIEKHLNAMLPDLGTGRRRQTIQVAIFQFQKQDFMLDTTKSVGMILAISAVFLILATLAVRLREYTAARAVQG